MNYIILPKGEPLWKTKILIQISNFEAIYKKPYMKGSNNIYFSNLYNNMEKTEVDIK